MRASDAAGQLDQLHDELREEIRALEQLRSEAADALRATTEALNKASVELAAVYLPALDEPSLMAAERRTGFRGFSRRSPITAMAKERARLEQTVSRTEADPEYQRRAYLVGPQGSVTLKLKEATDMAETWERECARFEVLEGFQELVQIGYDTPEFAERWWEASYWRHWKLGDAICAALGLADFGDDVLPAWQKAAGPREQWKAEVTRLSAERDAVLDKVQARDQARARLQNLEATYLSESVTVLAEHIRGADFGLLEQWRGDDRAVELLLRRVSGLAARAAYFQDLKDGKLAELLQNLGEQQRKIGRKRVKYRMAKHMASEVAVPELALRQKLEKIRDRRVATTRANQKVSSFDDFERWQVPQNHISWWTVWVNSPPPAWTPEWRSGLLSQPGGLKRDDDPLQATASSQSGLSPLGDLS